MKDGVYVRKMWVLRLTEKSKGRQQAVSSKFHAKTLQVEEGGGEAQEAPQAGGEAIGSIRAQADEGRLPENIPDKAMLPKVSLQLCLTVFRLNLVRKELYQSLHEDHSRTPAERDNQETGWVFEPHTHGKALEVFMLLEVCMSPVVLRHVGVELHLLCVLDT